MGGLFEQLRQSSKPRGQLIKPAEFGVIQPELVGTYEQDYDLFYGDRIVKNWLDHQIRLNSAHAVTLAELNTKLAAAPNRVEAHAIKRSIGELEAEMAENIAKREEYNEEAAPILAQYQNAQKPTPTEIGRSVVLNPADYHRLRLIEQWIQLANRFFNVYVIRKIAASEICPECHSTLTVENGDFYCSECHTIQGPAPVGVNADGGSGEPAPAARKKNYDLVGNFRKTFYRIQGVSTDIKLPFEAIKEKFDRYCQQYGTTPDKLTKERVIELLKKFDYPEHYLDVNLIMKLYADVPLPDYSDIEENIIKRYTDFIRVYPLIEKTRSSAPNIQYSIHKCLQLERRKTDPSDFKMTKGDATLEEYERIWKEACRMNGWEFIPSF